MFASSALLFFLLPLCVSAGGGDEYTYFEEGGLGLNNWATLDIEGNQCAGDNTNATAGFGQSPIALETTDTCDGSMSSYTFTPGDCAWEDLTYISVNNGVKVQPKEGVTCTFGTMKVPSSESNFNLAQFHLHTNAEHTIDSELTGACLHGVHLEDGGDKSAVFGLIIDDSKDATNNYFEYLLKAWEANWQTVVDECNANPITDANITFEPQQNYIQCPDIANASNTFSANVTFPAEPFDLYHGLVTADYGAWNYGGWAHHSPCTEFAHWNVMDMWLYVSKEQMNRLWVLTNCYIDAAKCAYQTIANTDGSTNRPVQDLGSRTVSKYCVDFADAPGGSLTGTSGVGMSSMALLVIAAAASTMALLMK